MYKELNEKLEKFLESDQYKLTIITDRDRDSDGKLTKVSFDADNDLEALLYVFKNYDLQNGGMFNGEYSDDELDHEEKEIKDQVLLAVEKPSKNAINQGIKLLTDLYFDNFDPSDYYDDIVKLESPSGRVIIEDDIDVDSWFGEDDGFYSDETDYEQEVKDAQIERVKEQEDLLINILKDVNLELKDNDTSFKGLNAYLKLPKEYYAVASVKSVPTTNDNGFSVEIFGVEDASKGKKTLDYITIEEVKQFLLDNYDQMVRRNEYLNRK